MEDLFGRTVRGHSVHYNGKAGAGSLRWVVTLPTVVRKPDVGGGPAKAE